MAISRFTAPDRRALGELAAIAKSAGLRSAERELRRARDRRSLGVELNESEMRALSDRVEEMPPRVRVVFTQAMEVLEQVLDFERSRDRRIKNAHPWSTGRDDV